MTTDQNPWKTAGLRSLSARLRLDAGLGVEYIAGTGDGLLRAVDTLSLAKPERLERPKRPSLPEPPAPLEPPPVRPEKPVPFAQPKQPKPISGLPAGPVSLVPYEPPPSNPEKESLLADLRRESESCALCGLCERRNSVVWGEGSLDADVMFIGEGPGKDEDIEGRPFVGRSGRLLTDIIEKGMNRPRSSVYIANVVKCRPPGNRDPKPEEVEACSVYLNKQIEVIKPTVIVAVGMVAGRALLGLPPGTSGLRSGWRQHGGIPLRVIYHPSFLLRQRQSENDRTKADKETWKDIQDVMKKVEEMRGGGE